MVEDAATTAARRAAAASELADKSRQRAEYMRRVFGEAKLREFLRNGVAPTDIQPGHISFSRSFNVSSAKTVAIAPLWPESTGALSPATSSILPDVTGAGRTIGFWEFGGGVFRNHAEFLAGGVGGASRVTQMDPTSQQSNFLIFADQHATHVAGSLIAAGSNSLLRGAAFQGQTQAWDSRDHFDEMELSAFRWPYTLQSFLR